MDLSGWHIHMQHAYAYVYLRVCVYVYVQIVYIYIYCTASISSKQTCFPVCSNIVQIYCRQKNGLAPLAPQNISALSIGRAIFPGCVFWVWNILGFLLLFFPISWLLIFCFWALTFCFFVFPLLCFCFSAFSAFCFCSFLLLVFLRFSAFPCFLLLCVPCCCSLIFFSSALRLFALSVFSYVFLVSLACFTSLFVSLIDHKSSATEIEHS